jgi:hypothetical protein
VIKLGIAEGKVFRVIRAIRGPCILSSPVVKTDSNEEKNLNEKHRFSYIFSKAHCSLIAVRCCRKGLTTHKGPLAKQRSLQFPIAGKIAVLHNSGKR